MPQQIDTILSWTFGSTFGNNEEEITSCGRWDTIEEAAKKAGEWILGLFREWNARFCASVQCARIGRSRRAVHFLTLQPPTSLGVGH